MPLTDPDEGRYALIARQMATSGDWLVPRLFGLPYLEKPPLLYWLTATMFRMFGTGELSARLAPGLAPQVDCSGRVETHQAAHILSQIHTKNTDRCHGHHPFLSLNHQRAYNARGRGGPADPQPVRSQWPRRPTHNRERNITLTSVAFCL